ncbi:MAG: hypothetical protein WEE50_05765 [Chloroflexota bacterium]
MLAQARTRRERERAALQFARDRDVARRAATMARLDAEAAAAVVRPSRIPTAAEARTYLESLPDLWAKTSDAGRHAIAEAVFERIDVLGVTDYTFTLTAHAKARGWDAAFGSGVLRLNDQCGRGKTQGLAPAGSSPETGFSEHEEGQSGRGERASPSLTQQSLRFVMINCTPRESLPAATARSA